MKKDVRNIICFSLLFFCSDLFSQISFGGTPPGLSSKIINSSDPIIDLPAVDTQKLINDDIAQSADHLKPYRFAWNHQVNLSIGNSGKWRRLDDGSRVWTLKLRSRNAYSLMVFFSAFELPDSARLYLYDQTKQVVLGSFTSENNNEFGSLNTTPVPGDIVTIEYYVPSGISFPGKLTIGMVGHDYRNAFGYETRSTTATNASSACEIDVNCSAGDNWQVEKRAVCRLLIPKSDGNSYLCTGTLINNTAQDGKPYVLSAQHCISDMFSATKTVFVFNYEKPYCNGPKVPILQSLTGSTLRATTTHLDFSLVECTKKPPFSYYPWYCGWNINTTGITNTTAIHHAGGDVKKIAHDNDAPFIANFNVGYDFNSHWKVTAWETGITEGGSSGSALLDQNHRIIGTLSGGFSKCGCTSDCSDYFSLFSLAWSSYPSSNAQLKYWLDPTNTGNKTMNGFDPYASFRSTCDTLKNIQSTETPTLIPFTGWGYWSGNNADSIFRYAEEFDLADSASLVGVYLGVGYNKYAGNSSRVYIKGWDTAAGNLPGIQLFSKTDSTHNFVENKKAFVPLSQAYKHKGKIFIGIEIEYKHALDTFALLSSPMRSAGAKTNTCYLYKNKWMSASTFNSGLFGLSLQIEPVFCDTLPSGAFPNTKLNRISQALQVAVYPNPAGSYINVDLDRTYHDPADIGIFDLSGILLKSCRISAGESSQVIDVSGIQPGLYVIRINSGTWCASRKISIIR